MKPRTNLTTLYLRKEVMNLVERFVLRSLMNLMKLHCLLGQIIPFMMEFFNFQPLNLQLGPR